MIAPGKRVFERVIEQAPDMRNLLKNEVPVASVNRIEPNVRIENAHLTSLADQLLEKNDDGALTQIIRIFFERQPDYTETPRRNFEDSLNSSLKMLLIARQSGFEQRQAEIETVSTIVERAHIFGRHEPPKAKPGLR